MKTINDIKEANAALGHHWFNPDNMKFFGSVVLAKVYQIGDRAFFITSEKQPRSEDPRMYTVREALTDGSIKTVSKFQQFVTEANAVEFIKNLKGD